MEKITLKASKRNITGKKVRLLRGNDITPANVYGHDIDSLALQCGTPELQQILARAGTTRLVNLEVEGEKSPRIVFIREVQKDAVTRSMIHIDFYEVKETEKMEADVPIVLVGEAPGMKGKGRILTHGVTVVRIESFPSKLPPQIEVDISSLVDLDSVILVKNVTLDPEIAIKTDPELMIVKVSEIAVVAEEVVVKPVEAEAAAAAAAAPGAAGEAAPAKPEAGKAAPEQKGKPAAGAKA